MPTIEGSPIKVIFGDFDIGPVVVFRYPTECIGALQIWFNAQSGKIKYFAYNDKSSPCSRSVHLGYSSFPCGKIFYSDSCSDSDEDCIRDAMRFVEYNEEEDPIDISTFGFGMENLYGAFMDYIKEVDERPKNTFPKFDFSDEKE